MGDKKWIISRVPLQTHVLPSNDSGFHLLEADCMCQPICRYVGDKQVIIHCAEDKRSPPPKELLDSI